MWTCKKCGETHEGHFDSCWKCGVTQEGVALPQVPQEIPEPGRKLISCLRCGASLEFAGVKEFKEALFWQDAPQGKSDQFEAYVCSRCGKAEFYRLQTGRGW